eukprot:CAMPEP_0170069434 /NCGR_PEP_ID=MMETSP0019_2-20121128/8113_1 /TAXON_ID=98059 /ORGANISM="Dinobryon sp., Strain UTEXLB2267" /LENGTH=524 /DNA_ID=CAMNT_0010277483 /DNA_START=112 /DNA_END=1683 /DNA_ORIENTATION=-
MPSSILFHDDWICPLIGIDETSIEECPYKLDNIITGIKTYLCGEKCVDEISCTNTNGDTRKISLDVLISKILKYLKECAEDYVKNTFRKSKKASKVELYEVVLGIPATFSDAAKTILRSAAHLAGFVEVHLMVESTAAAMAYGLLVAGQKSILVFDMGGGTTDLTVARIREGCYEIDLTCGHTELGGERMDRLLLDLLLQRLQARDPELVQQTCVDTHRRSLLSLCRKCKEALSRSPLYELDIPRHLLTSSSSPGPGSVSLEVHRADLEQAIRPVTDLVQAVTHDCLLQWLRLRGSEPAGLQEVVLVGGCSAIPAVKAAIRRACCEAGMTHFGQLLPDPVPPQGEAEGERQEGDRGEGGFVQELCCAVNPDSVVAEGLAVRGAVLAGVSSQQLRHVLVLDCLPNAIGVLSWLGDDRLFEPVLLRGDRLPAARSRTFPLDESARRFVSLDMYEEVQECRLAEGTQRRGCGVDYDHHYSYHLLSTVDVPAPWTTDTTAGPREVSVSFAVDVGGVLSFRVLPVEGEG